ncbi:MAG TPA: hypothetical protein VKE70_34400 [Candidatus Solibacter sp.]|nr:hypothetical protein [Candidatus Solibacter sp.]
MLRPFAVLLLTVTASAAVPPPKAIAPPMVSHSVAMFLSRLSSGGRQRVTFKAAAAGTHFFFEESAGVTVYVYDGSGYRKEAFLKSTKLDAAMKRYGAKP